MSSTSTRLPFRVSGTSSLTMRCARPSTIAVLPTPGSPISTGLFFVRRCRIWIVRRISSSRPITGSSLPCCARSVRSIVYLFSASRCSSASALSTWWPPRTASIAASSAFFVRPCSRAIAPEFALVVGHREQEHLARNETVAAPLRFLVGGVQQRIQFAPDLDLTVAALHLRQALDQPFERLRQRRDVDACALQQRPGAGVACRSIASSTCAGSMY